MIFIIYKDEAHIFHAYMAMKCVFQSPDISAIDIPRRTSHLAHTGVEMRRVIKYRYKDLEGLFGAKIMCCSYNGK